MSKYAAQIVTCKCVIRHRYQRFRRDSATPKLFTEPVSDLSGTSIDVMHYRVAYTTNCLARYVNRKIRFRFKTNYRIEPVACIALGVRIRKTIAQVDRDFAIVPMTHNRVAIAPLPTTNSACLQLDLHPILGNTAAPRGRINP